MPTLKTSSNPADQLTTEEIVETLLVEAGVANKLPTDQGKILGFLNLEQLSFNFDDELGFIDGKEQLAGKLRAALSVQDKVVAVNRGMSDKRSRFSVFHEVGHFILPEHRGKLFLDSDETLSWWTKARLEREANQVAADLLFQGQRFTNETLDHELSLKPLLRTIPKYGASFEAGFRRYVERHVLPCAVIVYDKVSPHADESFVEEEEYTLQYTVTSSAFRKTYFSGVQVSDPTVKASTLFKTPWRIGEVEEREIIIEKGAKEQWRFDAEVFSNGYKIFQMLTFENSSRRSRS